MEQRKKQHDSVREWLENSVNKVKDQTKRKLSATVVGKTLVRYGMITTLKKKLDEANDTHWEVHDSAVDESTSTDNEHCHDHENEVHEEEDVQ